MSTKAFVVRVYRLASMVSGERVVERSRKSHKNDATNKATLFETKIVMVK